MNAIYFDGRKDATQVTMQGPNNKFYRSVQLEDHYTMVGQPGEYYLSHFSTEDGKERTIAQEIFNTIANTELQVHDKLTVVGTDGTAAMTGKFNGCIRKLEELLNKPLQYIPMNYPCAMSLLCLMEPPIVLTHLQDQLGSV